jgi:hypothetical protein
VLQTFRFFIIVFSFLKQRTEENAEQSELLVGTGRTAMYQFVFPCMFAGHGKQET